MRRLVADGNRAVGRLDDASATLDEAFDVRGEATGDARASPCGHKGRGYIVGGFGAQRPLGGHGLGQMAT